MYICIKPNNHKAGNFFTTNADGKVVFVVEEIGEITVEVARVQTFGTNEPAEIHFVDGNVVKGKIESAAAEHFRLAETKMFPARDIALSEVFAINPPPKPNIWEKLLQFQPAKAYLPIILKSPITQTYLFIGNMQPNHEKHYLP